VEEERAAGLDGPGLRHHYSDLVVSSSSGSGRAFTSTFTTRRRPCTHAAITVSSYSQSPTRSNDPTGTVIPRSATCNGHQHRTIQEACHTHTHTHTHTQREREREREREKPRNTSLSRRNTVHSSKVRLFSG